MMELGSKPSEMESAMGLKFVSPMGLEEISAAGNNPGKNFSRLVSTQNASCSIPWDNSAKNRQMDYPCD